MPEETAGAGASTSRPQIPLLDNAGEYGRLYNYVKAVRELLGKGGEAYRRVKTQHPDIDSKIDSGNLRVINDIIFENSNLVGLGGIKREELAKIANYSKVLANAERSGNKIPSLNAVNNVKADYDNIMQEKLEQGRDSYQESKDKLKEIRKEKNKKNGKVVSRVVFGMLAAALALGLVAGFGLGVYGIVQTAMAASFTITSGFAVGGVAVALIAGRAIVKGLGALFRKISSSFKKANAERKEAKAKFKAAKREMNQNRRNDLSNQYALARDNESELISPYPGSEGISTISRSREATVDMVSASELSAISGEFAAERAAREAAAREAEARRAAAEHTAAAASEYSDEETLGREPDAGEGAPAAGEGAPDAGEGAPAAGVGAPAAGVGTPAAGVGTPAAGVGTPAAGEGAPDAGEGAPAAGVGAPAAGVGTPAAGVGTPAAGEGAPAAGVGAPAAGAGAPAAGVGAPAEPLTPMQEFKNKYGSDMVRVIERSYKLHFKPSGRRATTVKKGDRAPAYSAFLNDVASAFRMGDKKSEMSVNVPVMIDDYLKARGVEISWKKTKDPAIKVEDSHVTKPKPDVAVKSEEAPARTDEDMVNELLKSYKGKTLESSTIMKKLKVGGPKAKKLAEMYKKARAEERTSEEAEGAPKAPETPEIPKEKPEAAAAGMTTDDEIVAKEPTPSVAKEPEKKDATEDATKKVAKVEAEPEDDGWQELTENALKAGVPEELLNSMRERGMSAEDAYNTLKKDFTIAADKDGGAKKEDSDEPGSGA